MAGVCYIVGAGVDYGLDFDAKDGDLVIAADGGLDYLVRHGMNADIVIGDFDSIGHAHIHDNVITLSNDKDCTDTWAAIHEGLNRGYTCFHIYCGTGGRIDHTYANIQAISFLSTKQMKGYLHDADNIITAVTNGMICLDSNCSGYVSVFSASDRSTGVTIKGLKYDLDNAILTRINPIGVSNEFIGTNSMIVVRNGTLIVVYPKHHGD